MGRTLRLRWLHLWQHPSDQKQFLYRHHRDHPHLITAHYRRICAQPATTPHQQNTKERTMALKNILVRRQPEPPAEETIPRSLIEKALSQPQLIPIRLFWQNLLTLRPWWPILLPLLCWIGWRTYQKERAMTLTNRAARQAHPRNPAHPS